VQQDKAFPLVIDMDGTLLYTDMLHESAVALARTRPLFLWKILIWLKRGKALLKEELAANTEFVPDILPYNQAFLAYLREEHAKGCTLVLCTASHKKIATSIAEYLGIFDDVMASDGDSNLAGLAKARALVERYGEKGFDYAGNSRDDIAVWQHARKAVLVNSPPAVCRDAQNVSKVARNFPPPPPKEKIKTFIRAIRVRQWLKNFLLFVPAVAAHKFFAPGVIFSLLLAFFAFGLCSSSVYLVNDLLDLNSDRQHPRKRLRPLASGQLSIVRACFAVPIFFVGSLLLSVFVSSKFFCILLTYFVVTTAYSFWLKRLILLDCITLAGLYTLRIIAGGAAIGISSSPWLLAFSIFLFLSLAFVKRYAELCLLHKNGLHQARGRAYLVTDLALLQSFGISAGYTASLVMALYLNSDVVRAYYIWPEFLWLAVPVVIFWISWMWTQAHRGDMHDDPVLFALKDRTSLGCGVLFLIVFAAASFL